MSIVRPTICVLDWRTDKRRAPFVTMHLDLTAIEFLLAHLPGEDGATKDLAGAYAVALDDRTNCDCFDPMCPEHGYNGVPRG